MCALHDASDDTLEVIAHYLDTRDKCLLLATGDLILSRRLIKSTSLHTLRLGDQSMYKWNHLRQMKMPFKRLSQNPFHLDPSLSSSSSSSPETLPHRPVEFHNLIRLKIHISGAKWMQAIGHEEITKIFPQLRALNFYCRYDVSLINGDNVDLSFLSGLNALTELIFDMKAHVFPYMFPSLLPPQLDTLHVPQLDHTNNPTSVLFDFTESTALTRLYIESLDQCTVLPPNLTSLRLRFISRGNIERKLALLPTSLKSITIGGGHFDVPTLCSSLPASVTNVSTRAFYFARTLLPLLRSDLAIKIGYISVIADHDDTNSSVVELALGLPKSIRKLKVTETNRQQLMALIENMNTFGNLVELAVDILPSTIVASFSPRSKSHVTEWSITSIPDVEFPPSLRRLIIGVRISDFLQHTCEDISTHGGGAYLAALNNLGNIFLYRPFGNRTCPLSRSKLLEELKIQFHTGVLCADVMDDILHHCQAVGAIFDAIPTGLKSLSLNFVENACFITEESPIFTNGSFQNLMKKISTVKCLSFSGIEWNHSQAWFSTFPRTLKHLDIIVPEFNGFVGLNIADFPPFLKTLKYDANRSGTARKIDMQTQLLQLLVSYHNKTGKRALPHLQMLHYGILSYYSTSRDGSTFASSSLSTIENVNMVNRY